MAHLHYGYLDYMALQSNPFTATDESLAGWMALKRVYRKPASAAKSKDVKAVGAASRIIPAGTILNRGTDISMRLMRRSKFKIAGKGMEE